MKLRAGCVFVNGMVRSDPRLPLRRNQHSGYGRELGDSAFREFVNIKTVWINSCTPWVYILQQARYTMSESSNRMVPAFPPLFV